MALTEDQVTYCAVDSLEGMTLEIEYRNKETGEICGHWAHGNFEVLDCDYVGPSMYPSGGEHRDYPVEADYYTYADQLEGFDPDAD